MKVWALTASFRGCCSGCEDGYCTEYDEGTPVMSLYATKEAAEAANERTKDERRPWNRFLVEEMDVVVE